MNRFTVLIFFVLLSGCAITQTIDIRTSADIDLMNQRLKEHPATVYLLNDSFSHGRSLLVRHDSTFWIEQGTKHQRAVATDDIYAIEAAVFHSPLVYRKSFALGFTAGYMSMAALHLSAEDPSWISTNEVLLTLGVSLVTGVLGSVIYRSEASRTPGRFLLNKEP